MKKSFLLILGAFLIGFPMLVSAFPMPNGIGINPTTKECAGFWGGDERIIYTPPSGWEIYYHNSENTHEFGNLTTPYGVCDGSLYDKAEACCKKLNLTYISENIGKQPNFWQTNKNIILILSGILIIILIGFFSKNAIKRFQR